MMIKKAILTAIIALTVTSQAEASEDKGKYGKAFIQGVYQLFGSKTPGQLREEAAQYGHQQEQAISEARREYEREQEIKRIIGQNAVCGVNVDCYTVTGRN